METQGKRLMLAVAAALAVMFAFQLIWPSKPDEKKKEPTPAQGSALVASPSIAVGATPDGKPGPTITRGPEQTITLSYPNVEATFSNHGGVLTSWHLTDKRYDRDKSKGELIPQQPDAGAFAVNFANSTYVLPANSEWTGTKVSDREVKYTISTEHLDVEKTFTVVPEAYMVKVAVKATVKPAAGTPAHQTLALSFFGFQDPKDDGGGGQSIAARIWQSSTYRAGEVVSSPVASVQKKTRYEYNFKWTGFEHPYLLVGVSPQPQNGVSLEKQTSAVGNEGLMRTDVLFRPEVIVQGNPAPIARDVVAYLGPKHYEQMEAGDSVAGFETGFKETIDLGWFAFIGRPLMWLLLKFYSFLGNWGLAIMLLTVLVKGATIPFTTKSMRSMKAMAVLAPEMKKLQEKYKHDRQRLQMETMALYKQHGANPLSGCLPILLQMPIWLALYRMLSSTGELYMQPFIPGWINDLTTSDPYYILPFVLLVTMFLQARLTPMGPATDPTQRFQQRMMQYGLPLMFGVMAFFFPAGLTIYIFTNTVLSALHSIYMNKFDKKSIELAAKIKAAQEKAAAQTTPGKKPEKVIDAESTEADDDDEDGGEPARPAQSKPRPNQNRQKRKKRRR